jgi:hypothetical protein
MKPEVQTKTEKLVGKFLLRLSAITFPDTLKRGFLAPGIRGEGMKGLIKRVGLSCFPHVNRWLTSIQRLCASQFIEVAKSKIKCSLERHTAARKGHCAIAPIYVKELPS